MTTTEQTPGFVAGTWDIDPVHSDITFSVRHMGVGKSRGRFGTFQGEIVTAANPLDSAVTATVDVNSIDTRNADRDAHVRSADFFDSEQFPTATFRSTGIRQDGEDYLIDGELTIKGVTKPVTLDAELGGFTGEGLVGLSASTVIKRTDFGVGPEGGAMIGEKLTLTLDIEAQLRS